MREKERGSKSSDATDRPFTYFNNGEVYWFENLIGKILNFKYSFF